MNLLAVWLGKAVLAALRLLGRRGNALPGLVVEKLMPGYLPRILAGLPEGVVVVTGTNGKTTTTKMVATVLRTRYRVLTNDTGSNFVRGAITATIEGSPHAVPRRARESRPVDAGVLVKAPVFGGDQGGCDSGRYVGERNPVEPSDAAVGALRREHQAVAVEQLRLRRGKRRANFIE